MQLGHSESHLKQSQQAGIHSTLEDCIKDRKVSDMAPKRTHNGKTASAQEGLREASRQVRHS